MHPILIIVFAPLAAAIIGGLGNKALGSTVVKSITTGALFLSCALSWPIFLGFLNESYTPTVVPVLRSGPSCQLDRALVGPEGLEPPTKPL